MRNVKPPREERRRGECPFARAPDEASSPRVLSPQRPRRGTRWLTELAEQIEKVVGNALAKRGIIHRAKGATDVAGRFWRRFGAHTVAAGGRLRPGNAFLVAIAGLPVRIAPCDVTQPLAPPYAVLRSTIPPQSPARTTARVDRRWRAPISLRRATSIAENCPSRLSGKPKAASFVPALIDTGGLMSLI